MNFQLTGELLNVNRIYYFLLYSIVSIVFVYIGNHFLVTEDLYYSFFEEQMSFERIAEFIDMSQRIEWLIYLIIPVYLSVKFFVVAACLSIGTLLWGYNADFRKLFQIAMFADAVFLIPPILKIIWFGFVAPQYDLADLQYFLPLSALNLFDPREVEGWFLYPLQVMNVFELVYWLALAWGLKVVLGEPFPKMLGLVSLSYVPALLLWVTFIVFASLSLS